ncbi:MAG TPA: lipoate--protein ligase [Bacteroidales bacterium]|nr:lipoate--protein ligase [Bacteroidales bacterium]
MRCITLQSYDPFFYLASEEHLLRNTSDEYLILAINSPSVIIGKHQSPHREVNTEFVVKNNIPVIRRISGGGTVFHDMGNLNFTFIMNSKPGKQVDFRRYTEPVIDFLGTLGVEAKFEGKNDIRINGLKISGNAEHVHRNRVLHHGTLLFSSDLDLLRNSLRKDTSCYKTRAVDSNPSSVSNLNRFLPSVKDINDFKELMIIYFMKKIPGIENLQLPDDNKKEITLLADSKFRKWEWNYAYGPDYQFIRQFDYQGIRVECRLKVKAGVIQESFISGSRLLEQAAQRLVGVRHMPEEMERVILNENITGLEIFSFF